MKKFFVDILGILVQIERASSFSCRPYKSMLLIINLGKTITDNDRLRMHGAHTPPACIYFAIEIEAREYSSRRNRWSRTKSQLKKKSTGRTEISRFASATLLAIL